MKLTLICMILLCGCGPDQPTRKYSYDPGPVEYYKGLPPGRMPNKKPKVEDKVVTLSSEEIDRLNKKNKESVKTKRHTEKDLKFKMHDHVIVKEDQEVYGWIVGWRISETNDHMYIVRVLEGKRSSSREEYQFREEELEITQMR